jgi:hypothetical protein
MIEMIFSNDAYIFGASYGRMVMAATKWFQDDEICM